MIGSVEDELDLSPLSPTAHQTPWFMGKNKYMYTVLYLRPT